MTAILTILRLIWPYLLTAAGVAYGTHYVDSATLARYKASVAEVQASAQLAARNALEKQLSQRTLTEANNAQVIQSLTAERDVASRDRDLAQRLLSAAQARPAASHSVPETRREPGAPTASPAPSDGRLADVLAATFDECRANAAQLTALIAEIQPQL